MPIGATVIIDGIETAAVILSLVKAIIYGVKKVVYFKKRCRELAGDVTRLLGLLEKHKESIDRLDTVDELRKCLSECLDFVIQCQSRSIFTIAVEVALRHRYPKLKHELDILIDSLSLELDV